MLIAETGVTVLALLLALGWPDLGAPLFRRAELVLARVARRPVLSVIVVGASVIAIRLALLPVLPIPQPYVHDEFSFLLAADTFASGRLTNPTHPLWTHFESFHITQIPTYMSMYFPAQGLMLAAGKVVTGEPWFGALFASALMCGAFVWALRGWLPPNWALFGGAISVLRLGLFSYWTNSYYGGAMAAVGGALVLGALPRFLKRSRVRDALLMSAGIAILANSRPWEGTLICAPAVFMALRHIIRTRAYTKIAAPALLLAAVVAWMGYYNYRVFGNAFTLPYQTNRAEYALAPVSVFQKAQPAPIYRHAVMRDFYTRWEMDDYREARTLSGYAARTGQKGAILFVFLCGALFLPAMFLLPRALAGRRVRYIAIAAGIYLCGLAIDVWLFPHYLAPFAVGFYVILMECVRRLRAWRRPFGRAFVRLIPAACIALALLRAAAGPLHIAVPRFPSMWYGTEPLGIERAATVAKLAAMPGRQLAIVRYSPTHRPFDDWV